MYRVNDWLKRSLIARTGFAMGAIVFVTLVTVFSSAYITDKIEGHAVAINVSGSLRMGFYRLAVAVLQYEQGTLQNKSELRVLMDRQSARLHSPVLTDVIPQSRSHQLNKAYQLLLSKWEKDFLPAVLKSDMSGGVSAVRTLDALHSFVGQADLLVSQIQLSAEDRVRQLQVILSVSIFIILFIVLFALLDLFVNVVKPLRKLMVAANAARQGDFSYRIELDNPDELGTLAEALNMMAEDLSKIYGELESRVDNKTEALKASNLVLQLFYNTARHLAEDQNYDASIGAVLDEACHVLQLKCINLCLLDMDSGTVVERISSNESSEGNKESALSAHSLPLDIHEKIADFSDDGLLALSVQYDQLSYGILYIEGKTEGEIENWKIQALRTISDNIATCIALNQRADQQQRISLMEERTVIARELHDSLAQALSYLKIQVTRLKSMRAGNEADEKVELVINDLSDGLNSAYRQLRELLTTFRLNIGGRGLQSAVRSTIEEFSERGQLDIEFVFKGDKLVLNANEDIHVLQIIREALSNVIRHSGSKTAEVMIESSRGNVTVSIIDRGTGISSGSESVGHFGIAIMNERAARLNGRLFVKPGDLGGTVVSLQFMSRALIDSDQSLSVN